ncbi:MAG: hypothetical protein ACFE9Z_07880 [Promethearchaeota archaeon]
MLEIKNLQIECVYKEDDISPWIKIKITDKLKSRIKKATQHLVKSNYPYDALCWALAEFQLIFEKGHKKYSEHEVIE